MSSDKRKKILKHVAYNCHTAVWLFYLILLSTYFTYLYPVQGNMLLSRHSEYLTNNKECMTPAMKICRSGKAHGFEEVTAPGIMLILAINMHYFFKNQIRTHVYFLFVIIYSFLMVNMIIKLQPSTFFIVSFLWNRTICLYIW